MNVKLGEHFEKLVEELIAVGRFQNQSEVVQAGLRLLEEREYGLDRGLESELTRRLKGAPTAWTKRNFDEVRKLGQRKGR